MPKGKKHNDNRGKPKEKAKQVTPGVGQHPFYDGMLLREILSPDYYQRLAQQSQQQTGMSPAT